MSELFPDNRTANADELRAFVDDVLAEFANTPTKRELCMFVADNGETIDVAVSPLESFVVEAALYGVNAALMMLPDGSENPFTGKRRRRLPPDGGDWHGD